MLSQQTGRSWVTPANTTIDLYVALKPYCENALTDMLYEVSVSGHPKHVHHSFTHACTNECHCSGPDMVHTSLGSRLLSLLLEDDIVRTRDCVVET